MMIAVGFIANITAAAISHRGQRSGSRAGHRRMVLGRSDCRRIGNCDIRHDRHIQWSGLGRCTRNSGYHFGTILDATGTSHAYVVGTVKVVATVRRSSGRFSGSDVFGLLLVLL